MSIPRPHVPPVRCHCTAFTGSKVYCLDGELKPDYEGGPGRVGEYLTEVLLYYYSDLLSVSNCLQGFPFQLIFIPKKKSKSGSVSIL